MVNEAAMVVVILRARTFVCAYTEANLDIRRRTPEEAQRLYAARDVAYENLVAAFAALDKREQPDDEDDAVQG